MQRVFVLAMSLWVVSNVIAGHKPAILDSQFVASPPSELLLCMQPVRLAWSEFPKWEIDNINALAKKALEGRKYRVTLLGPDTGYTRCKTNTPTITIFVDTLSSWSERVGDLMQKYGGNEDWDAKVCFLRIKGQLTTGDSSTVLWEDVTASSSGPVRLRSLKHPDPKSSESVARLEAFKESIKKLFKSLPKRR